jgi:hypothetical protein
MRARPHRPGSPKRDKQQDRVDAEVGSRKSQFPSPKIAPASKRRGVPCSRSKRDAPQIPAQIAPALHQKTIEVAKHFVEKETELLSCLVALVETKALVELGYTVPLRQTF